MNWLQSLKIGDEVIESYGLDRLVIRTVTKSTSTQIHVDGTRYRRSSGRQIGSDLYSRNFLREPTPELRAKVEEDELRRKISDIKFEKLPLEIIRQVLDIVQSDTADFPK